MALAFLDRMLYRHPFEGASARRYATAERPAFGDLDDRLLDRLAPAIAAAGGRPARLVDVGAGPATFARAAAARFPRLDVVAIEPSHDFVHAAALDGGRASHGDGVRLVRAAGEDLPLADASCDVAMCLSSIRHVRDRERTLRELRRVVRAGGVLWIVELDPEADRARIANHADHLGSAVLRRAFGPLVVRTAPRLAMIETLAHEAGWSTRSRTDDPVQPVYILELA